jgi:DNA-directed RNA polymerase subunit RPC12/RpoP
MFQYDEQDDENIILCINCDAEYTITKIDDEEQEAEFCPYCGYHQIEDEYDEFDEEEDDEGNTLQ